MLTSSFPRYKGDFAGNFIYGPTKELVSQGVKVFVIAPVDISAPFREMMDGIVVRRFKYMYGLNRQRLAYRDGGLPVTLKQDLRTRLQIIPFVLSFFSLALGVCRECDIIHAHWTLAGAVAMTMGALEKKPIVLSLWGADVNSARGSVLGYVNRWLFQKADRITTVSEDLREQVLALGLSDNKVALIPNSVDETQFRPFDKAMARRKLGVSDDRPLILYVGSLIERKGVSDIVSAMSKINAKIPEACLFLLGEGHLRGRLETQVDKLGLKEVVSLVGVRDSDEIPLWMNAADVLVLPSYSEGRPTVILEAMACETPVVASDISGNRELVRSWETGLLAKVEDSGDIAEKLIITLRDYALRRRLGHKGRQLILKKGFTWRANAQRLNRIYHDVVKM
jgi:glycosyltransferase involved in cell wall biosynthesis